MNSFDVQPICIGRKHPPVHLLFFLSSREAPFMQRTVLFREQRSVNSRGDCGGDSLVAELDGTQFAGDHTATHPAGARPQAGGWMQKIARALVSMTQVPLRQTADHGMQQLSKGWAKRMHLSRGGRLSCRAGKVWITLDEGGEDIVLTACESKNFGPGAYVLVEALADSRVFLEAL